MPFWGYPYYPYGYGYRYPVYHPFAPVVHTGGFVTEFACRAPVFGSRFTRSSRARAVELVIPSPLAVTGSRSAAR